MLQLVVEMQIRKSVGTNDICSLSFMPGRDTIDAIFIARQLQE